MNSEIASLIYILTIGLVFIFIYSIIIKFIRPVVFFFAKPFFWINKFVWIINNPLRWYWKNPEKGSSRGFFVVISLTGISILWWIISYIITTPLRIILAIYYNIILFLSVSITDNIEEFVNPKIGKLKYKKGIAYLFHYLITLPFRFIKFLFHSFFYLLDSFLMAGVSIVFPTLTMFHGTKFKQAGSKITQTGNWLVGAGNYTGTGIYFGIEEETAKHYAPKGPDSSIIIARVSLSLCKTIATLKKEERQLLGEDGEQLAINVKGLYASVEHWRAGFFKDSGWWEYCILKPKKMGQYINSWRLRPVAIIKDGSIVRIYGGFSHYCKHPPSIIAGIVSWYIIAIIFNTL